MLRTEYETMLALDSCVVIGAIRSPRLAKKILRLFRGNHSRIVLQDVVLREAQKILGLSKEVIIEKITSILRKEIFVFATTDEMKKQALVIEKKYGVCHYPDSIILVSAKIFSWTILTLDRNMLRAADFEGILAFNPMKVGGN